MSPPPSHSNPFSAVRACPGLTLLLGCISGWGGVGEGTGAGISIGAVDLLLAQGFQPRTSWLAGLCLWPGFSSWPVCREAQAGVLREVAGPQPLAVVASRRLWAISWSFESGRALGSSQGLC